MKTSQLACACLLAAAAHSQAAEPLSSDPAAATPPRIIQGNDQVFRPGPPAAAVQGPAMAFRFEEAPVADVVTVVMRDILKADYVLHPPVGGTITLATRGEVSADQAVFLLEAALQTNGLVMARDARGVYHVGKPEAVRAIVPAARHAGSGPLAPGYGAIVVPLQYIGAQEMANILRPMAPPDAIVRVDNVRNLLVLVGTRAQAEGWLSVVSTFDVDLLKGMSVGVFPLKHASIQEVEAALRLMTPGAGATGGAAPRPGAPGVPGGQAAAAASAAALAESHPLFGAIRVMPIERLNSILVVTPRAAYLEEARRWIERLDRPDNNSGEAKLHVYAVQNGSARHLAEVLNGIFGEGNRSGTTGPMASGVAPGLAQSSATTVPNSLTFGGSQTAGSPSMSAVAGSQGTPGARSAAQGTGVSATQISGVRVVADEINNAVLVYGTQQQFAKIEASLRQLDVPATQVMIEATIVEVTLNNDLQYGLQWVFSDALSRGRTGTGVLSNVDGGLLGGAVAGFSYTLRNSMGNVRAVLNALAEKSLVKVISSPSLMVLDNHTAAIAVGNQQPIRSAETITTGGNVSTSIQYKDTGVALAVTPSVNSGNMVTMQINQAVTDVGEIDRATGQRSFLQRQIGSKVAVRSGETLVLGGLIRDNSTQGSSGIPGLSQIPVLGGLFGTKISDGQRTELLVIITPRVVRTEQDAREISNEMRGRMRDLIGDWPTARPPVVAPAPLH